jgi:RNA polymerase sigma-70 factor, ECF subfamily
VLKFVADQAHGDDAALDRLIPIIEADLRRLARGYMRRERADHTLQVTALINEAFLKLTDARRLQWQDRAHFLGISARLMRRVLVDHARARGYEKRGGGLKKVALDEGIARGGDRRSAACLGRYRQAQLAVGETLVGPRAGRDR